MIELIIASLCGIITGTITGITPGLHSNLVASIIISAAPILLPISGPLEVATFLTTAAITHTFLDGIPAVLLGVADGSELMALTPSQKMVLAGQGRKALLLLTTGAIGCLIVGIAFMPLLNILFPIAYNSLKNHSWIILAAIVIWMLLRERGDKLFWRMIIMAASGVLGLITLRQLEIREPLLPMLTGLFGVSSLLHSMLTVERLPEQSSSSISHIGMTDWIKSLVGGTIAGGIIALLPGLGPAQAAIAAKAVLRRMSSEAYLIVVGGINTANMTLSLVPIQSLGFARNGAFEAIATIMKLQTTDVAMLASVALCAGGVAVLLTILLSRPVCALLNRINYRKIAAAVLCMVITLVFWRTGLIGMLVLLTAAGIGMTALMTNAPRHNMMACIMIPVITMTFR